MGLSRPMSLSAPYVSATINPRVSPYVSSLNSTPRDDHKFYRITISFGFIRSMYHDVKRGAPV